jgi:hypothetical protein
MDTTVEGRNNAFSGAFWKQLLPIYFSLDRESITTCSRCAQHEKHPLSNTSTEFGISMRLSVEYENAPDPIIRRCESGPKLASVSELHDEKQDSLFSSTESGMEIRFRAEASNVADQVSGSLEILPKSTSSSS